MEKYWVTLNVIKYAHNTYNRRTRKMPSEDTIVLLPEEKLNSCQRDSECWRVPGACTYIVIDDGVTSMRNAFDRDNAMLGKNYFHWELALFDNWRLAYTITTSKSDQIGFSSI